MATNFFGGAFYGGEFFSVSVANPSGGGGGTRNVKLPQYYSRRVLQEKVTLPQEPKSHKIAVEVLNDTVILEKRLAKDDRDFSEMLEITDHLLKQVAVYVESQQIQNIVSTVQSQIQARRDAELSTLMKAAQDDAEFMELMEII